jgi:hypothetical protein
LGAGMGVEAINPQMKAGPAWATIFRRH